jgi:hypothetical protein
MGLPLNPLPSTERLRELFSYNPETGVLTWVVTRGPAKKGVRAGSKGKSRTYRVVSVDGKLYFEHRVCFAIYHGKDPWPHEIDHIDRNPTNNSIGNLRIVTLSQQNTNRILPHRKPIKVTWPDGSTCVARGVGSAAWLTQTAYGTIKQRVRRRKLDLARRRTVTGIVVERWRP